MPARPASRRSARRAAARAAERAARARPAGPRARAATRIRWLPLGSAVLWWAALAVLLGFTAVNLGGKITWYLAVDQFGYLTFAHDLLHGHVFHHWPPLDALVGRVPPRVDILAQSYVAVGNRAYCRYSPGFPILLAAWLRLFGDDGAHYLNPSIFVALLVLLLAFARRIFRSRWRALAAVALVTLFPTYIHLWAITPTRDLSAHLAAFLGLYLLLPGGRHRTAAGAALGFAVTIRPDAVLYLVPGGFVLGLEWLRAGARWRRAASTVGAAALGMLLGLAPLLAYNWMTSGNPLRPTQAMEVERFFEKPGAAAPAPPPAGGPRVGYPPPGWHGGTVEAVQGGGLRLSNLPSTLPGNVGLLRSAYGDLMLAVAIWGVLVALVQRRALFVVAVPYVLVGLFFFSCWSRPDGRYLSGVFCMLPMLIVEGTLGTLDLVRRLARRRLVAGARGLAFGGACLLLLGAVLIRVPGVQAALPTLAWLIPSVTAAALFAAAVRPDRRVAAVAAPVLAAALTVVAVSRAQASLRIRGGFQRPEMLRARATFARAVEPGAVVITTEDVGRPAENIEYYSGIAWALYFTDLTRWGVGVREAAERFARARMKPYLLIPPTQPDRARMLEDLGHAFLVERVADIPPGQAMDYFVAAPFHRGVRMELYRLTLRE